MKNQNRVVLITGAAQGIGEAIAYQFASLGDIVVLNDFFNFYKMKNVEENIKNRYGTNYKSFKANISDEADVYEMVNMIIAEYGKIDVLVNNAAIVKDMDLQKRDGREFRETINNNLTGTYIITKKVSENMLENKKGRIVNIVSTNGIDCINPESIDYDASKAGIISLTKNFAKYLAPYITVNAVAPGWVNTEMNKQLPDDFLQSEQERIYLRRFAEPEEIANLVYFLASDEAGYINAETIKIDGGM